MSRRHSIARRLWRARADLERRVRRRDSTADAMRVFGGVGRASDAWPMASATTFDRYRSLCEPVVRRAAVVCVSQRPDLIDDVAANLERQLGEVDLDVVVVTNHEAFGEIDVARHLVGIPGVTVVERPSDVSLGACLNAGLAATSERFVAKFDDDDWYGPHFLADALRAHGYAGAGVVGKHSYYADVGAPSARYLRFPGHEFSYSGTLAGGTLVIDRDRARGLTFADVSIGEDRQFLADCHRRGVSTFSADRFEFVQRRGAHNTWSLPDDVFLAGCTVVDPSDPAHDVGR